MLLLLTHWGRVKHICVGKLTTIGSDNGLSPGRRQGIIWTNAGIMLIGPLGTNFSEILTGIQIFSFKEMYLKMSSAKWRPFGLGLNVLMAKIYLKTVVITFLETSKLVGLIMSGWNVTFWPTVNMQHCPARLQWDNLFYEWQTRRCVYVDLFIYASILAPTKVPVATGIETLRSAPVVYRDAVLLMGQYGKPTNTTLIHL